MTLPDGSDFGDAERSPRRIQWRRGMGKLPDGARYVGRPSRWGNPFVVGRTARDRYEAVGLFDSWLWNGDEADEARQRILDSLPALRGHDLACACPLDGGPCHADVLLDLANGDILP